MVNFISWEGPEANPSFLPEVFDSLEKPGATFVSPFSGIEVSPLEYYSRDPLSPLPPGKCLASIIIKQGVGAEKFLDLKDLKSYLQDFVSTEFSSDPFPVYFSVLTDKGEQLWKSVGPNKLFRVFKRRRR